MPEPYYQQDGITIYHGDCRDLLPSLGRFDLLLTDPPYGINASNMTMGKRQSSLPKKARFKKSDWDTNRCDLRQVVDVSGRVCIWGGNYYTDQLPPTNDWLVWHKQNDGRSFSECEFAWTNFGEQSRHFSWRWQAHDDTKLHATQKPLALMRWCLSFVPDCKTVLDPFMGSGTTLVAAKLEGRQAVGIEIEKRYCEMAANRLRQGVLDFGD